MWQYLAEASARSWLAKYEGRVLTKYKIFSDLVGCEQDPIWHPEGDAWTHTKYVLIAMSDILDNTPFTQEEQMILMFAALLHDVGKHSTTQELDGRITSRGHAEAGVELARQFLKDNVICDTVEEENAICILVQEHMAHAGMGKNPSRKAVKRLVKRLADNKVTMEMWYALVQADHYGRPPLPRETPIAADKVYAEAFAQQCEYDGKKLYEV